MGIYLKDYSENRLRPFYVSKNPISFNDKEYSVKTSNIGVNGEDFYKDLLIEDIWFTKSILLDFGNSRVLFIEDNTVVGAYAFNMKNNIFSFNNINEIPSTINRAKMLEMCIRTYLINNFNLINR